jgi:hypothetical protein
MSRRIELTIWTLALVAWIAAAFGARSIGAAVASAAPLTTSRPARTHWPTADSLTRASSIIASADLFRLERKPSTVAYRPELEGVAPPSPPPKPPHPQLSVAGIVGGPPWEALLDGVPGREGSVLVRKGDVLGDLKIRAVRKDTVIVQGADTTWKLALKHTWQ